MLNPQGVREFDNCTNWDSHLNLSSDDCQRTVLPYAKMLYVLSIQFNSLQDR
jgi:hypothetical protein